MKAYRLPIIIIAVLFIAQIIIEMNRPKPVNWEPTFKKNDKLPYGTYILYKLLPDLFGSDNIKNLRQPLYNEFPESDTSAYSDRNYLFITHRFEPDSLDIGRLLEQAHNGANIFIAAGDIDKLLADTLGISLSHDWFWGNDTLPVTLFNRHLQQQTYNFSGKIINGYFSIEDTQNTVVLGQIDDEKPNFIKIKYQKGAFFLHATPYVFTNYALLNDTSAQYAAALLSHLPPKNTYWGEYYQGGLQTKTPLRYFMSVKALRYMIWVLAASLLLFMLFEAKRKQRVIPIIEPLKNTSLDFAQTVGLLYFQKGDHKNVAEKKIIHFFDHIRTRYFLQAIQFTPEFYTQVANKSGIDETQVAQLFKIIVFIRTQPEIDSSILLDLSHRIDRFYTETQNIVSKNA